jgi:hypothetical protein
MSARTGVLQTLLLGTCLIIGASVARGASPPWAQSLTQQALDSGFLTRLPPAVSVAFGLTKPDEGTEVRQLLTKDGHHIRTFNVGVANHADLVIYNLNAQTGAGLAYLLTPDGKLRKAVSVQAGKDAQPLPAADAQAGLAREAHFWAARAHAGATRPAPH